MVFNQRLPWLTDEGPKDWTREDNRIVSAEVGVRLLAGHDQEVAIGMTVADVEVSFLLLETQRSWIARVAIAVEIGHHCDVDAERLLVEVRVEMTDGYLEAGQRLVPVVVSELHHRLLCGRAWPRAEIVVNGHVLPGPGWRVVERKVPQREAARLPRPPLPYFIRETEGPVHLLLVGLADAHRERAGVVFAVPHVAQVQLDFAAEEEFVRRREDRDRATGRLDYR